MEFTIQVANEAGRLLLDYFKFSTLETSRKADRSLVTEADLAANQLITQAIQEHFPGEFVLSEEGKTTWSPGNLSAQEQTVWIVDPLDGTTNFSLGLAIWGILLTRMTNGWPEFAVAHFPVLNESYTACHGSGAWLNDRPIQVDDRRTKTTGSFFSCCSRTFRDYTVNLPYKTRNFGSAAYSFCQLARGAALISFDATPKIWDIAGPWLIVSEAGGCIETLNSKERPLPLQIEKSYSNLSFPTLAAASTALIERAKAAIQPQPA